MHRHCRVTLPVDRTFTGLRSLTLLPRCTISVGQQSTRTVSLEHYDRAAVSSLLQCLPTVLRSTCEAASSDCCQSALLSRLNTAIELLSAFVVASSGHQVRLQSPHVAASSAHQQSGCGQLVLPPRRAAVSSCGCLVGLRSAHVAASSGCGQLVWPPCRAVVSSCYRLAGLRSARVAASPSCVQLKLPPRRAALSSCCRLAGLRSARVAASPGCVQLVLPPHRAVFSSCCRLAGLRSARAAASPGCQFVL